jgi:hypothetical protein
MTSGERFRSGSKPELCPEKGDVSWWNYQLPFWPCLLSALASDTASASGSLISVAVAMPVIKCRMVCDAARLFTGIHRQNPAIFFPAMKGTLSYWRLGTGQPFYRRTIRAEAALAMTIRIIPILAVASIIGPSLVYGSPACMTESEARAKLPKAHLYWHRSEHCWNDSPARALAAVPVHSRRPAVAAVPLPPLRPALEAVPLASSPVEIVSSGIDVTGAQCRYSPCE